MSLSKKHMLFFQAANVPAPRTRPRAMRSFVHACAWYKGNDGFICMGEPSTGAAALITAPPAPSLIGAARH